MKKVTAFVLATLMAMTLVACGSGSAAAPAAPAAAPAASAGAEAAADDIMSMNIMVGHCDPEDINDPYHHTAVTFVEKLEELSGGKIKGTVYPNAQLGDERSVMEQVQNGSVDATCITGAVASNFATSLQLLDIPFIFGSLEEARAVAGSEYGQKMLDELSTVGIKGLAISENGFRYILNTKHEIKTPEDLVGLKLRVIQSPVYLEFYKAVNSSAVAMAFGEVYTAMSQGTVDGFDLPMPVILSSKLYEVSDFITDIRYTYTPILVCVNQAAWDSWNEATQKVFLEAAEAARQSTYASNDEIEKQGMTTVKEAGLTITEYDDVDVEEFRELSSKLWEQFADTDEKKEILDGINEVVGAMR
ncbi:MAG: TRAP transporter substrate-binding protein [Lachnospiraceae bacterium]|nr:TRAP transporter substrate-binding protein [Lachnospiraceae bacterium]